MSNNPFGQYPEPVGGFGEPAAAARTPGSSSNARSEDTAHASRLPPRDPLDDVDGPAITEPPPAYDAVPRNQALPPSRPPAHPFQMQTYPGAGLNPVPGPGLGYMSDIGDTRAPRHPPPPAIPLIPPAPRFPYSLPVQMQPSQSPVMSPPQPGQLPYLYPPGYVCKKCHNAGIKEYGSPCGTCARTFARSQTGLAQPSQSPAMPPPQPEQLPFLYPPGYVCKKCHNTGIKKYGSPCGTCARRFARPQIGVAHLPQGVQVIPAGSTSVYTAGDPRLGGVLCGNCKGRGWIEGFFSNPNCEV